MIRTLVIALCLALPAHAQGQAQCGPRAPVIAALAEKYGETRRAIGMGGNGMVVEVWASEATGTFTVTVTTPAGVTCLTLSGGGFEALDDALPVPGVPG